MLRTPREETIEGLEAAIRARHATGYLSDRQSEESLKVLHVVGRRYAYPQQIRRAFVREAPKGEETVRLVDGANSSSRAQSVDDIGWLCVQRLDSRGWVHECIRPEVRDFQVPFCTDLYVFRDRSKSVVALLDHRERRALYPGGPEAGYLVLYVDPRFDHTSDRGKAPELDDWRRRTEAYLRGVPDPSGDQLTALRVRGLRDLCSDVRQALAEDLDEREYGERHEDFAGEW